MPATSLLTLIDDIAMLLDDVALMTKVASKKTAGLIGDDLAVNAEQVTGLTADRELPVVWAVFKGSALNKVILVPAALAISALLPWLMTPLLMLGGTFLCFEGAEKVIHHLFHRKETRQEHEERMRVLVEGAKDVVAFEKEKVEGAIRTDFVLSAEIIVIALGTMMDVALGTRIAALTAIAALMTVGVYGLVAAIVRLDDVGLALSRQDDARALLGRGIVAGAPYMMKTLGVAGTIAMFLVGGGILRHGIAPLEHWAHEMLPGEGPVAALAPTALDAALGVVAGVLVVALVTAAKRLRGKKR